MPERRAGSPVRGQAAQPADAAAARRQAIALLARRDFSVEALKARLAALGFTETARTEAIRALKDEHLLDDERVLEQALMTRINRGQGPLRIAEALEQAGLDPTRIATAVNSEGSTWVKWAQVARVKRFGRKLPADERERARQARFLLSRGFTEVQVDAVLAAARRDDVDFADEPPI